jgi:hypothetical protein
MNDDFVKQLRTVADAHESGLRGSIILTCLKDAADEIERLKTEIEKVQKEWELYRSWYASKAMKGFPRE